MPGKTGTPLRVSLPPPGGPQPGRLCGWCVEGVAGMDLIICSVYAGAGYVHSPTSSHTGPLTPQGYKLKRSHLLKFTLNSVSVTCIPGGV